MADISLGTLVVVKAEIARVNRNDIQINPKDVLTVIRKVTNRFGSYYDCYSFQEGYIHHFVPETYLLVLNE